MMEKNKTKQSVMHAASRQDCIIRNLSQTQKNRLYETVLLSTQNMFEQMNKKIIKILQQNFFYQSIWCSVLCMLKSLYLCY